MFTDIHYDVLISLGMISGTHMLIHWAIVVAEIITICCGKLPPMYHGEFNWGKYRSAVIVVLRNQIFGNLLLNYFLVGMLQFSESITSAVIKIPIMWIIYDFIFYWEHRGFHHPAIYKYVHKHHHRWTQPLAIGTFDAAFAEHFLCNILPVFIAAWVTNASIITLVIFNALATLHAMYEHSGWWTWNPAHYIHHRRGNCEFGALQVWDTILRTRYTDMEKRC